MFLGLPKQNTYRMNVLILAVLSLFSLITCTEGDKHCRPCQRSSSSSSSSRDCRNCPDEKARKKVKSLQAEAEYYLSTAKYDKFDSLTSYSLTWALNILNCTQTGCCYQLGDDFANSLYTPGDQLFFLTPTPDYIKRFPNGTIVVSKIQVKIPNGQPGIVVNTELNFHWNPVSFGSCNFELSYIDGNSINCPNFVFELPACAPCTP